MADQCPFCGIAEAFPPSADGPVPDNPDPERVAPSAFMLLSTPTVVAFMDIMPISPGHVLICPRPHREKLKDVRGNEGAALGTWLPVLSKAVMRALGKPEGDWNIVQNNGASAAQVVPHVHYHIIPRVGNVPEIKARSWTMFGRGKRAELDDEEGVALSAKIRKELREELEHIMTDDTDVAKLLSKL